MAVRTQIPCAQQLHLSHSGQHAPPTHLPVTGLVTTGARHLALVQAGRIAPQQLAHRGRSGSMHGSPHGHLDGLQIECAGLALLLKDKPQKRAHFPFDFLPNRFRGFFPAA